VTNTNEQLQSGLSGYHLNGIRGRRIIKRRRKERMKREEEGRGEGEGKMRRRTSISWYILPQSTESNSIRTRY